VLAGAAAALAVGTLQSGVFVMGAVLVAHVHRAGGVRRAFDLNLLVLLAVWGAGVLAFYPLLLQGLTSFSVDDGVVRLGTHDPQFSEFGDTEGARRFVRALVWYEPVLLILSLLALAAWSKRFMRSPRLPGRSAQVVLGHVLPYALVLMVYSGTRQRFLLPLLPTLAVFSVWGAEQWWRDLGPRLRHAAVAALALLVAVPVFATAKLSFLRSRPDTIEQAAAWVESNLDPERDPVFLWPETSRADHIGTLELPLGRTHDSLLGRGGWRYRRHFGVWAPYQIRLDGQRGPPPRWDVRWTYLRIQDIPALEGTVPEHLASNPTDFFSSSGSGVYVVERRPQRDPLGFLPALDECGKQLAHFYSDPASTFPIRYTFNERGGFWPHPLESLTRAETWGPPVEIFDVELGDS
jgi:hypothetical protein